MANPFNATYASYTGNGSAKTVTLGYRPVIVELLDATNNIEWKVKDGMAATTTIKETIASPCVKSITSNSDLAITDTGFTVSATANANAASLSYYVVREES